MIEPAPRPKDALAPLLAADERLRAAVGIPASLDPVRRPATPLAELGRVLLDRERDAHLLRGFAEGMAALVSEQLDAFPENIFWDFDLLASEVLAASRRTERAADTLEETLALMASLQRLFGRRTAIHFRYVHDFIYGYDWAKWVRRDPAARSGVRPYDAAFLRHMEQRGGELLSLIAADDRRYPRLPDGRHRNPFGFSREPSAEEALLRHIARDKGIPVEAWRVDGSVQWDRPYHEARQHAASELDLV